METPDRGEIGVCGDANNREDVPVNEVIEAESSDEESALVEIETVHPDGMFDFCMDQIVNASTREARQEARDLLVDNFDEISVHEFDLLDVIVEKGKQSRVEPEQPFTSQVSHNSIRTQANRKTSQKQLDYMRKYREDLKKHPAKYQKALQKMRDYNKKRWQQMSEDEKRAFRQRGRVHARQYYHKLSAEKKREKNHMKYQQRKLTVSNKFACKFSGCGKSFLNDTNLIKHEHVHLRIKPFICTWPSCQYSSSTRGDVIRHVNGHHFKLPRTKQQQQQSLNINHTRNPNDHIRVDTELAKRRLE